MSADLMDELNELISDEDSQLEYRHELTLASFTNGLAGLMEDLGVSQAELARRLGVSRARVSQVMQHKSSPTLRSMVELADALGCDVSLGLAPRGGRSVRAAHSRTA